MTSFNDFGLAAPILSALVASGYETPTPIQAEAIPHLMGGRDLLGTAQTGTGKTAAFALPIIHRLATEPKRVDRYACRTLVLAPTRELASQIAESFRGYTGTLPISVEVVFGGTSIGRQERAMSRGVDVLVATPGRLIDLVERGSCRLDRVETLVLDEADQMLDLGFIHALRRIARLVPKTRQTLLFSATMPKAIAELADGWLHNPIKVSVAPIAATADRIDQTVYFCDTKLKQALLEHLLAQPGFDRVIVFARTKHGADRVVKHLDRAGVVSAAIHGNKSQGQRERALSAFRDGEIGVLVATDIAARGIDIDGISHVVNYDLPNVPESYVHRIGRTARAGAEGSAVSFCNGEERSYLKSIERLIRRQVPNVPLPRDVHARAAEIAKAVRQEGDDERVEAQRAESHRHAGRPQDGRRGGDRHQMGEKPPAQGRGPRGERGPRAEFRARDEARSRDEGRGRDETRGRDDFRGRDDVRGRDAAAPKAFRDTRHGEPVAPRAEGRPAKPRPQGGNAEAGRGPRGERPTEARRDGGAGGRNGIRRPAQAGQGPKGSVAGARERGPRRDA